MKCIRDITSNPAFNWTDDELAGLTQGLTPDDVSPLISLYIANYCTLYCKTGHLLVCDDLLLDLVVKKVKLNIFSV